MRVGTLDLVGISEGEGAHAERTTGEKVLV